MSISLLPFPTRLNLISINRTEIKGEVVKVVDKTLKKEEYELSVCDGTVTVRAAGDEGFFYAEKTLDQLRYQYGDTLPELLIEDNPKYEYRSFMIDCCRHFFSVDEIKKMIDLCAAFKFNKFHWHLSEDQGWRIQIDKYPQLTEIGSVRHGTSLGKEVNDADYGGYYTKDEIRDVVAYAKSLCIDTIPEIDLPGHTSALLASIPEMVCGNKKVEIKKTAGVFQDIICAGKEKNYEIIFDILDEVCELFPYEYFHIGGDEAPKKQWKECPECQAKIKAEGLANEEELQGYFVNRISEYLRSKGKKVVSWNESVNGGNLNDQATIQFWLDREKRYEKYPHLDVIVSDFFAYYMDYPYEMTPLKKTYCYDEKIAKKVIGVETPVWTEYIPDFKRMLYLCFPRYIAVAQTAWCENKPSYERFESDLCNLMGMFDTTYWAPKADWNRNQLAQKIGTAKFFIDKMNKDFTKQLIRNALDK